MLIVREKKMEAKDEIKFFDSNKYIEIAEYAKNAKYGFAIDVGTTTVVVYMLDIKAKKVLDSYSATNEQARLGSDVMMRIMHCKLGKQDELHSIIINQIEKIICQMMKKNECIIRDEGSEIALSVVGNTTMCHLFLNKNVEKLGEAPYKSEYEGNYFCDGKELRFKKIQHAKIAVLSCIKSHVGSDALAVLGSEKNSISSKKNKIIIDLGTNAEILIKYKDSVWCASAAAGPAFEGKGVICGMRAGIGAITKFKIMKNNGNIIAECIESGKIKGISATGVISLISELLNIGIIRRDGYLITKEDARKLDININLIERVTCIENKRIFRINNKIFLSQDDIRNVQLAIGAINAAIKCMLEEIDIEINDIEEIVFAGAMGNYVDMKAAENIGLIPYKDKVVYGGNMAGIGAIEIMFNRDFLKEMEEKAKKIIHIELAENRNFKKYFIQGLTLG